MAAGNELEVSDYIPAHFLHASRGLQQIIALPEFQSGQLQVLALRRQTGCLLLRHLDTRCTSKVASSFMLHRTGVDSNIDSSTCNKLSERFGFAKGRPHC